MSSIVGVAVVGSTVGAGVGPPPVGGGEGASVGVAVVGSTVGGGVGLPPVGGGVGTPVGVCVGPPPVGTAVGVGVGSVVGNEIGFAEIVAGLSTGAKVGINGALVVHPMVGLGVGFSPSLYGGKVGLSASQM